MYHPVRFEEAEANRLNKIFHYTLTNFQNKISLTLIASVANLSPKAFCMYQRQEKRIRISSWRLG